MGPWQELNSGITDFGFKLVLQGSPSDLKLALISESDANHKLPPRTPLLLVRDARLVEHEGETKPEIGFTFKNGKACLSKGELKHTVPCSLKSQVEQPFCNRTWSSSQRTASKHCGSCRS